MSKGIILLIIGVLVVCEFILLTDGYSTEQCNVIKSSLNLTELQLSWLNKTNSVGIKTGDFFSNSYGSYDKEFYNGSSIQENARRQELTIIFSDNYTLPSAGNLNAR